MWPHSPKAIHRRQTLNIPLISLQLHIPIRMDDVRVISQKECLHGKLRRLVLRVYDDGESPIVNLFEGKQSKVAEFRWNLTHLAILFEQRAGIPVLTQTRRSIEACHRIIKPFLHWNSCFHVHKVHTEKKILQ